MQKQNAEPSQLLSGRATCRNSENITLSWRWGHKMADSSEGMFSPRGPTFACSTSVALSQALTRGDLGQTQSRHPRCGIHPPLGVTDWLHSPTETQSEMTLAASIRQKPARLPSLLQGWRGWRERRRAEREEKLT